MIISNDIWDTMIAMLYIHIQTKKIKSISTVH